MCHPFGRSLIQFWDGLLSFSMDDASPQSDTWFTRQQWASRNTKLSAAISPRSLPRLPKFTACASLLPMRSSPNLASGTFWGLSSAFLRQHTMNCNSITDNWTRSRKPTAKSLASTSYVLLHLYSQKFSLAALKRQADGKWANCTLFFSFFLMFADVDSRKKAAENQKLRYLAALWLSLRNTQHVQGVPWAVACRCRQDPVPGYGR